MPKFSLPTAASVRALMSAALLISPAAFAQTEAPEAPAATAPDAASSGAATHDMAAMPDSGTMERADADMKLVLQKLKDLGAKPIDTLTVEQARTQPTPTDAVKAVLEEQGKSSAPEPVGNVEDIAIPGPAGDIAARVYTPEGEGPFPVIVYFHGGGWVIADLDVYDATPRAMVNQTGAIVVSSHYRQGPENPFPSAHEDAVAAYKWVVENAGSFNGDSARIAVMGESAGGGLAAAVALAARDQALTQPLHMALVYPIAGTDTNTQSYQKNRNAAPLSKGGMEWFFDKYLTEAAMGDPRVDLVGAADVAGLPPATIVTAEIDPLRSEGQALADKLVAAGVDTEARNFEGAAHEFFGMAAVVADAKDAQGFVAERLRAAFAAD